MFETLTEKRGTAATGRSIAISALLHGAAVGAAALVLLLGRPPEAAPEEPKEPPVITFHPPAKGPPKARGGSDGSRAIHKDEPRKRHRIIKYQRVEPTVVIEPPQTAPAEPEPTAVETESFDGDGESQSESGEPGGGEPGAIGAFGTGAPSSGVEEVHTFGLTQGMTRPMPGCRPAAPLMPEQARSAGIEGKVTVYFVVHADGRVGEVRELGGRAPPILFKAVEEWLASCAFQPSMLAGRPVSAKMSQTFNFRLR